jgi:hypothetical protein
MVEIVPFVPKEALINKAAIEMLKEVTEKFESGEYIEFAMTVLYADRNTGTYATKSTNAARMVGGLFIAMQELSNDILAHSTEIDSSPPDKGA